MMSLKIGFVLLSHSQNPIPSTRIAALNLFRFLRTAGMEPHIVFEPQHGTETPDLSGLASRLVAEEFDVIVFQKVHGPSVEALIGELRLTGIRTVYLVCDLVHPGMASLVDATIVVTNYLKSLYPSSLHEKIHVVHDGIEHPDRFKNEWGNHRSSIVRPLRAVLVTSAPMDHLPVIGQVPGWLEITIVGRYPPSRQRMARLQQARWMVASHTGLRAQLRCLRFLTNPRVKRVAWDAESVYAKMLEADIGIIPIDTGVAADSGAPAPGWKVKSENRLSMKMSLCLPVIATEIPSYTGLIENGVSGFFARTRQDWLDALETLRDPEARQRIGKCARDAVLERYSMEEQARLFIAVLNRLPTHPAPIRSDRQSTPLK